MIPIAKTTLNCVSWNNPSITIHMGNVTILITLTVQEALDVYHYLYLIYTESRDQGTKEIINISGRKYELEQRLCFEIYDVLDQWFELHFEKLAAM